jgi:hypothetical protein
MNSKETKGGLGQIDFKVDKDAKSIEFKKVHSDH